MIEVLAKDVWLDFTVNRNGVYYVLDKQNDSLLFQ